MDNPEGKMKMRGGSVAEATLPIEIFSEGEVFVAHCPALRLASHGHTQEAARAALDEAVRIFFEEIERMGTLEEVLLECGWVKHASSPDHPPRMVPPHIITGNISVPGSISLPA